MANLLLLKRDERRVGKCWTDRFIARQPKLCTRFCRPYDYQRALQEDPDVLNAWFRLVANMRAKYGIQDGDFYNFDETGFMMGMVFTEKNIKSSFQGAGLVPWSPEAVILKLDVRLRTPMSRVEFGLQVDGDASGGTGSTSYG
jgi:hypothetical protein